ncbi:MAG: mycofactocin biosynthesis glycosyltransferase MftF [Acidimicrobiales bacterium]|nr:mycofactocin biosynthesis glycosyltransferase MftF [Acidimicrobiales bacterium]
MSEGVGAGDIGVPAEFRLALDPSLRRPHPRVLLGGSPVRLLRLSAAGAQVVDRWAAGSPVGPNRGAQALARRMLDVGLAHPRPARPGAKGGGRSAAAARLAVVVPVRDDPDGLAVTLRSLAATAPSVQVVVVDDGSSNPVELDPAPLRVRSVWRAINGGPAAARNTGRAAARSGSARPAMESAVELSEGPSEVQSEVIVFVDAGCELEPGWPASLLPHFADPAVVAAAPRVSSRADPSTPAALAAYEARHSPLDLGPSEGSVRPFATVAYVPSAALAVRASAFDAVGGFDETLRFGEDVDLMWRLVEEGGTVRYEPAARATHPTRPTLSAWTRQRYHYGRSATPLASRHGRAVAPVVVAPWSGAAWGLSALGHPAAGAIVAVLSSMATARRAGGDDETEWELVRLALRGHGQAGPSLATAIRRAWLPPFAAGAALVATAGGSKTRRCLLGTSLAALFGPGLAEWARVRPPVRPLTWLGLRLADDLAYQAGVWSGAVAGRSLGALLPRW